jgi:hypothetical protein
VSEDRRLGASAAIPEPANGHQRAARRSAAEDGPAPLPSLAAGRETTKRHGHHGRGTLLAAALVAVATFAAQPFVVRWLTPTGRSIPQAVAVVPYWNFSRGLSTVLANKDELTMVSPWMYGGNYSGG